MTKLSDLVPAPRTAGQLPSSRTEGMLADALKSDDIDFVKSNLQHTWSHYQSLEFYLNAGVAVPGSAKALQDALDDPTIENDMTPVEFILAFYAGNVVQSAYEEAHQTGMVMAIFGKETVPDALRFIYDELDHTDPDAHDLDAELAELIGDVKPDES